MKIGFIGCGNLAQALINGLLKTRIFAKSDFMGIDRVPKKLKIQMTTDLSKLTRFADVLVLATKPQDMGRVLKDLAPLVDDHVVISLAAGVANSTIEKKLKGARSVIRVMANTPALVGHGAFGIYQSKGPRSDSAKWLKILNQIGFATNLASTKQVDAMTSAVSSGTGWILYFMENFEKFLVKKGFSKVEARALVLQNFYGTSILGIQSRENLQSLRKKVTSKKGTTEAGFKKLEAKGLESTLQECFEAAFQRCGELGRLLKAEMD